VVSETLKRRVPPGPVSTVTLPFQVLVVLRDAMQVQWARVQGSGGFHGVDDIGWDIRGQVDEEIDAGRAIGFDFCEMVLRFGGGGIGTQGMFREVADCVVIGVVLGVALVFRKGRR
jgi:hypothetical protein